MAWPIRPDTLSSLVVYNILVQPVFGRVDWEQTYLDVKCGVEAHLQSPLVVFVEYTQEALLEDGGGEGVGKDDDTVRRVGHGLHFQKTDLVQATGEKVDCVAVVGRALGQALIELKNEPLIYYMAGHE